MPGRLRTIRPPSPTGRAATRIASLMASSPGNVWREVELHEHGYAESGDDGPPVDRDSFRLRWHLRTPPGKGSARPRAACARATNARPRHGPLRVSSRPIARERRRLAYARSRPEVPTQQHAQAIIRDMLPG